MYNNEIPFFFSNCYFFELVGKSRQGLYYSIELVLDVASTREKELAIDGTAIFDVSFKISHIVKPGSSKNALSVFPISTHVEIMAKSLKDNRTYKIPFDISILNVELIGEQGQVHEMPGVEVKMEIKGRANTFVTESKMAVFSCAYCGYFHPTERRSKEHIIAESLKNTHHILSNTCLRFNNYMALAFENQAIRSELFKEILLRLEPPNEIVYRGKIVINNEIMYRYVLPSGVTEIVKHPEYSRTNILPISVKGRDGKRYAFDLKLPFSYINGITGPDRMLKDRLKKVAADKKRIMNYCRDLENDQSINKDLERFLREVGATFNYKSIDFKEVKGEEDSFMQSSGVQNFRINFEVLNMLFLKIAWTHAVFQLGEDKLKNPVGEWILKYLTMGHINDPYLVKVAPELFTSVSIDKRNYFFWKFDLDESESIINKVKDEVDKSDLSRLLNYRKDQFEMARQFVTYHSFINDFENRINNIEKLNYHSLEIKNIGSQGKEATFCYIELFGGYFQVSVQISDMRISNIYPSKVEINF